MSGVVVGAWVVVQDPLWEGSTISRKRISLCNAQAFKLVVLTRPIVEGVTSTGEFAGGMIESNNKDHSKVRVCRSEEVEQDSIRQ